jgi:mono/diheme cytochrome c family protein
VIQHPPSGRALLVLCLSALLASLLLFTACAPSSPTTPLAPEATASAAATLEPVSALLVPHVIQGQEQCGACHGDAMPEDHAGREDRTCLVCHDPAPTPQEAIGASAAEKGQSIWQKRANLSCRDCHGFGGQGGFGPALMGTGLNAAAFVQRTRSPLTEAMPPIAASLDDPNFERSGVWIGDQDLLLVYSWLSGSEVEDSLPAEKSEAISIPHQIEG